MHNVGLIGYGYWAPNIARNLNINPKINLKWICDKNSDRIEKAKSMHGSKVKYSNDFNEIINDKSLNAVVIGVETSAHYNLVKKTLIWPRTRNPRGHLYGRNNIYTSTAAAEYKIAAAYVYI